MDRLEAGRCEARILCRALFIPCIGARDDETAQRLTAAFQRPDTVRSLHRNTSPDETCWCAGQGWWLSPAALGD
jgi:protein-L-isoaspartate(D-aspartate) O-methyltransferase